MKAFLLANKNKIAVIVILAVLGFFWYSYQQSSENSGTLPIIYAPTSDYKIKPDDPGGYDIQNEDVTIYKALRGEEDWDAFDGTAVDTSDDVEMSLPEDINDEESDVVEADGQPNVIDDQDEIAEPEVENLFDIVSAPASEPNEDYLDRIKRGIEAQKGDVPGEEAIVPEERQAQNTDTAEDTKEDIEENIADEEKLDDVLDKIVATPAQKPTSTVTTLAQRVDEAPEDINEEIIDANDPSLTHFVQLGSFRSETAALTGLSQFQSKYKPVLDGVATTFEKVTIPEKGDFVRVKAGPMTKPDASSLCDDIKAKQGSCYVTAK